MPVVAKQGKSVAFATPNGQLIALFEQGAESKGDGF